MNKKTPKQTLAEVRDDYKDVLADHRPCHHLVQLGGGLMSSKLAKLAEEVGHCSLQGYLNLRDAGGDSIAEVAAELVGYVAWNRAPNGADYDEYDDFMAAADAG